MIDYDKQWADYTKTIRAEAPGVRAQRLNRFKLYYYMQHDHVEATPEQIAKAYQVQFDYYLAHPNAVEVPLSEYGDLIPRPDPFIQTSTTA